MTLEYGLAAILSLAVGVYLVYALVRAEKF
jgi:K+-transporting ATPase KdpF subunit